MALPVSILQAALLYAPAYSSRPNLVQLPIHSPASACASLQWRHQRIPVPPRRLPLAAALPARHLSLSISS